MSIDGGNYWTIPIYDSSNQQYVAEFPIVGNQFVVKAILNSPSQKYTPVLSNIQVTAIDFGNYASSGTIVTKDINIPVPSPKLVLEMHGLENNGSFEVSIDINGEKIQGVATTADEVADTSSIGLSKLGDKNLREIIEDKNLQTYYYRFELPENLTKNPFTTQLTFKLNSNNGSTMTPYIHSYILYSLA